MVFSSGTARLSSTATSPGSPGGSDVFEGSSSFSLFADSRPGSGSVCAGFSSRFAFESGDSFSSFRSPSWAASTESTGGWSSGGVSCSSPSCGVGVEAGGEGGLSPSASPGAEPVSEFWWPSSVETTTAVGSS